MNESRNESLTVSMHVGQLLQRHPGGIGRYITELLPALEASDVEVETFAAGAQPEAVRDRPYRNLGRPGGRWRYELWHRFRRPALDVSGQVVHAPSLAVPPAGDRPLVVTVHDLAFIRLPQYFTVRGLRFHERGLALARQEAAVVITPSRFAADELVAEGFEPGQIHVARHGIRHPAPQDRAEVDARIESLGLAGPYLLFVSTLEPRKGIDTLMDAWPRLHRRHPDLSLVLVGGRGWGRLPKLDWPGVVRMGAVPDDDLDALYRGATALCYPSYYEGFGLPVLEAMVRGCPVVTSSVTSLPEVVGDAGILLDPGDADLLLDALEQIVDDPDGRRELVERGHRRATEFTWDVSARAHRAAYEAAAAPREHS